MTRRGRPTIRDVARRAGVSKGMVSFALGADPFFPTFIASVDETLSDRGQGLVLQVVPEADAGQLAGMVVESDF